MLRVTACFFLLLLALAGCALAADGDCSGVCASPLVTQSKQTSWTDGFGVQYSVWDAFITASSGPISSVAISVDANSAPIDQIWEMVPQSGGLYTLPQWRLQNGGIPAGQTHRFGYTIRSSSMAPFQVSTWNCPGVAPSPSPAAPSPSASPVAPSPSPSAQPPASGSTTAVCSAVLVIDNYIVRNLPGLTEQQIKAKYAPYFADVTTYYATNFNLQINFDYVYVEMTGSFSDAMDGGQLLDDFKAVLHEGRFEQPTRACIYHLLTGRQPYGVGGLAWVGTACGDGPGFSVDGQANENPEDVIRRAIHEIGHNLGGDHPDAYPASEGYTCSINDDRASDRILRAEAPAYNYLSPTAFISDCATAAIKSSLPSYSCMWSFEANNNVSPLAIFCADVDAEGGCLTVAAHYGVEQCYNLLPFNDQASSFQLFPGTSGMVGLELFYDVNCRGPSTQVRQYYSPTLPEGFNDQVTSFRFIRG